MDPEIGKENSLLIIHPPAAKACEAPGGPARLAGALRRRGLSCRIWDANLEGQLWLLEEGRWAALPPPGRTVQGQRTICPPPDAAAGKCKQKYVHGGILAEDASLPARDAADRWTRRAARYLEENLAALRSLGLYGNGDRYRRAAADINRLLAAAAGGSGVRLSLADYEDRRLSPVRSADLIRAAALPEANPFYPWFSKRLPEIIEETPVIGFSLNYLSQALTAFAMIGCLKRARPRLRIILGGGLVTSWLRRPGGRNPFAELADGLIAGPGEAPLLALFGKTHDGGPDRPDFDGLPLDSYLSPGVVLPYSASSGCWWRRCSFCPEQAEGNPYRPVPPAQVTADLRALTAETRPALIHLLDNAISPELLEGLAAAPPGAPWYGFTRITARLADPDFCLRLKDAGCVMLQLGLESGDPEVLAALNKGIDPAAASAVLKNLKAAGIATYVYLLFGTPAETPAAARRTLAFALEHAEEIGFLNLAIFNLPAYGPETEGLATGEFYAGDLSFYRSFSHPRGWDRREVRRFLEDDFKRRPAIAAILRRDPPFFTSNHAPFFALAAQAAG